MSLHAEGVSPTEGASPAEEASASVAASLGGTVAVLEGPGEVVLSAGRV